MSNPVKVEPRPGRGRRITITDRITITERKAMTASGFVRRAIASVLLFFAVTASQAADDFNQQVDDLLATVRPPGVMRLDIGVTRRGTKIPALVTADDLDYRSGKTRVLLVGFDTSPRPEASSLAVLEWFYTSKTAAPHRDSFALSAIPVANPDGWAARRPGGNLSGGRPRDRFPPEGIAYGDPKNPEAHYLWRWIGMSAPDLVIVLGTGSRPAMLVPAVKLPELSPLKILGVPLPATGSTDLATALVRNRPSGIAPVPAVRIEGAPRSLKRFLLAIFRSEFAGPSPARREIQQRLDRSPVQIAGQLARRYGHQLDSVAYIPALALVGRVRLGELTGDRSHLADVERIVKPYVDAMKPTIPKGRLSGSNHSGHLVFAELARVTGNKRYIELARAAADLGFDKDGKPLEAMPANSEMSDSVFMGCPILVETGRLTGEAKYDAMALRHLEFMLKTNRRPDGLHAHSPLDPTPWGRGNGFPALGLAWCLSHLPDDAAEHRGMLAAFQAHLAALVKFQDPTGTWHQVVNHPGSYREFTSTCMITYAMIRGVRRKWLDAGTFVPVIERAWPAIQARIAPDATLVDVCTGTGKQKNLRAYFDRTAILGADNRGGAMALLVTTEMARWRREQEK